MNRDIAADYISKIRDNIDKKYRKLLIPAGSYRREEEKINDIDLIVVSPLTIDNVIERLQSVKLVGKILNIGIHKCTFNFISKKDETIQVDLWQTDIKRLPYALLYFTGSKVFNIHMRRHAAKLGMKLNANSLYDKYGKEHIVSSEKEIFDLIKMKYYKPSDRSKG